MYFTRRLASSSAINMGELNIYARKKQSKVNIRQLLETGRGAQLHDYNPASPSAPLSKEAAQRVQIQVACFLHRELPVRLAHRVVELQSIPIMRESKYVCEVISWYTQSFQDIRSTQAPIDPEKEEAFHQVVNQVYSRHAHTLITMAKAAHEMRMMLHQDLDAFAEHAIVQDSLDKFYLSRIGLRTLIGQYLALRESSDDPDRVGIVDHSASPYAIAKNAINDATYMCTRTHGDAPQVTIHGRIDLDMATIPEYIHYILLELLKNSMRATVEFHGVDNEMPRIKVIIADGENNEDVVIKVSDEGGGIPRSHMKKIWSYLFTTADSANAQDFVISDDTSDFNVSSPLAGLGYGLPIARNYARHLGGDLAVMSMEGYGTDSFVYLARI